MRRRREHAESGSAGGQRQEAAQSESPDSRRAEPVSREAEREARAPGRPKPDAEYEHGYADGRHDAEVALYLELKSGPFDRDPERMFNRGRNLAIDYEKDRKDRY